MGVATHKLAKSVGGRMHYAVVTVLADFATDCSITVAPGAFEHLRSSYGPNAVVDGPGFEADRAAAILGAEFALSHIEGREGNVPACVVIECIRTFPVDTTPADITYAACLAVWEALGVEGTSLPELAG
jgi:hypothetical protein